MGQEEPRLYTEAWKGREADFLADSAHNKMESHPVTKGVFWPPKGRPENTAIPGECTGKWLYASMGFRVPGP